MITALCLVLRDRVSTTLIESLDSIDKQQVPLSNGGPLTEAVITGKPVWLESASEFASQFPAFARVMESTRTQACACLPLIVRQRAGISAEDLLVVFDGGRQGKDARIGARDVARRAHAGDDGNQDREEHANHSV